MVYKNDASRNQVIVYSSILAFFNWRSIIMQVSEVRKIVGSVPRGGHAGAVWADWVIWVIANCHKSIPLLFPRGFLLVYIEYEYIHIPFDPQLLWLTEKRFTISAKKCFKKYSLIFTAFTTVHMPWWLNSNPISHSNRLTKVLSFSLSQNHEVEIDILRFG